MISRQHAQIVFQPCQQLVDDWAKSDGPTGTTTPSSTMSPPCMDCHWRLIDLKSLNGLFVNDVKVSETVLVHGDIILFGSGYGLPIGQRKRHPINECTYRFEVEAMTQVITQEKMRTINSTIPAKIDSASSSSTSTAKISNHEPIIADDDAHSMVSVSSTAATVINAGGKRKFSDDEETCTSNHASPSSNELIHSEIDSKRRRMDEMKQEPSHILSPADHNDDADSVIADNQSVTTVQVDCETASHTSESDMKSPHDGATIDSCNPTSASSSHAPAATTAASSSLVSSDSAVSNLDSFHSSSPSSGRPTNDMKSLVANNSCSLCSCLLILPTTLPTCSHRFCSQCITDWFMRGQFVCPECKIEVDFKYSYHPTVLKPDEDDEPTIAKLVEATLTPDEKKKRSDIYNELRKSQLKHDKKDKQLIEFMAKARAAGKVRQQVAFIHKRLV